MEPFIFLGLLAAAGWGTGDFLSARSSRKTNPKHTLFWLMVVAPSLWLAFLLATNQFSVPPANGFLLALAVGACFYAGDLLFNISSTRGKIAVASPLLALAGVFAISFAVFLLRETPSASQVFFGVLAVSGGVLLSLKNFRLAELENNAAIMLPAAVMHGLALTLSKPLFQELGVANAAFWQYAVASVFFVPLVLWKFKGSVAKPLPENFLGPACYFVAYWAFLTGVSSGMVSLVAPVSQLLPLFAVGLAFIFYGERLRPHQWLGVAVAVLALAGLSSV